MSRGGTIQLSLEPGRHPVVGRVVGTPRAGGGIARLRSFTITFSQVSAELASCSASALSSVRLAVLRRSLWQVTQYRTDKLTSGSRRRGWRRALSGHRRCRLIR